MASRKKQSAPPLMVSREDVAALCGCSRTHIYTLQKRSDFPKPIDLTGSPRWFEAEVIAWLQSLPRVAS